MTKDAKNRVYVHQTNEYSATGRVFGEENIVSNKRYGQI